MKRIKKIDIKKEPQVLAIIGNGFDLHFGLKTRYSDFYAFMNRINTCVENYLSSDDNDDYWFEKYHNDFINDGKGCILNQKELSRDLFYRFKKEYSNNFFVKYFLYLNNSGFTWAGIETELDRIIHTFDKANIGLNYYLSKDNQIAFKVDEHVDKFLLDLFRKINYSDLYGYSEKTKMVTFMIRTISNIFGPKSFVLTERIISDFNQNFPYAVKESLKKFEMLFYEYWLIYLPKDLKNEPDIFRIQNEDLLCFNPDNVDGNHFKPTKIINFNYTDYCMHNFNNLKEDDVRYIHGAFNSDCNLKFNIIFGINSSDDEKFNFVNFKIFSKNNRRKVLGSDSNLSSFLKDIQTVVIYGHSLDKADRDIIWKIIHEAKHNYEFEYCRVRSWPKEYTKNSIKHWQYPFKIVLYSYEYDSREQIDQIHKLEDLLWKKDFEKMYDNNDIKLYATK